MADNLRDDERFQVAEARRVLSAWDDEQAQFGGPVLSRENVLADQIRNLLAVVDAVAPEETRGDPMTDPQQDQVAAWLAEVKERAEAATAEPWYAEPNTAAGRVWVAIGRKHFPDADMEPLFNFRSHDRTGNLDNPEAVAAYRQREADAAFVVSARTDVPRLLAAVEAALGHHVPAVIEDARPPFRYCDTCSGHPAWPCPEVKAIAAALLGEGGQDD